MVDQTVALVTGAGRNVGLDIAKCLASKGVTIALNDVVAERAEAGAAAIREAGGSAVAFPFDVTVYSDVTANIERISNELGLIDTLVNNAGIPADGQMCPFLDSEPESWRPYLDLNLIGSLNVIRAVLPAMVERRWGRIIQISSGSGSMALPGLGESMYAAGKAGIEGAVRQIASEVGRLGVTANTLALGLMSNLAELIETKAFPPLNLAWELTSTQRLGTGQDVGEAIFWLASHAGGYVNGQTIHLNGGAYSGR